MRGGHYFDTTILAATAFGRDPKLSVTDLPTRSELSSVRRALAGLAEQDFVFRVGRKWTRDKHRVLADRIRENHYSGSVPSGKVLYFEHDGAIVVFSIPANPNLSRAKMKPWLPNVNAESALR